MRGEAEAVSLDDKRGVGLIKQERRKMHVRTGVPYEHFFEWSSWEAARLLNETRTRGDDHVSIKEMVTGRRVDMANARAAWGCRAIVRKPIAWRDGKETTAEAVDGVYMGKHPRNVGFVVWTPEYGFVYSSDVVFIESEFPFASGRFDPVSLQRARAVPPTHNVYVHHDDDAPQSNAARGDDDENTRHPDDTDDDFATDEPDTSSVSSPDASPQPAPTTTLRRSGRLRGDALPYTVFAGAAHADASADNNGALTTSEWIEYKTGYLSKEEM